MCDFYWNNEGNHTSPNFCNWQPRNYIYIHCIATNIRWGNVNGLCIKLLSWLYCTVMHGLCMHVCVCPHIKHPLEGFAHFCWHSKSCIISAFSGSISRKEPRPSATFPIISSPPLLSNRSLCFPLVCLLTLWHDHGPLNAGAVPQLHDRLNHCAANVAAGESLPGLSLCARRSEEIDGAQRGWMET